MRAPKRKAKTAARAWAETGRVPYPAGAGELKKLIHTTARLWRRHHLSYDQARYVAKEVRRRLEIERPGKRRRIVARLGQEEQKKFIAQAYKEKGTRGLMMKTLLQTGVRVSEFAGIKVEDVYLDECTILIRKAKGGKSRSVPILPELGQELRTYLNDRETGYLFETNRADRFSPRRIQQIVREIATKARIHKRVYPHLLRHTIATALLERGMTIEQIQKFLGHERIDTTQIYAESSPERIRAAYQQAMRA